MTTLMTKPTRKQWEFEWTDQCEWIFDRGVSLEMSENQSEIAKLQVRLNLLEEINAAQDEDPSVVKLKKEVIAGHTVEFKICDGVLKQGNILCIPGVIDLRQRMLQEAHCTPYSVHPGATKIYHDVKEMYWWSRMKKDVAQFVASCLTYQQVNFEHQRPTSLLQELPLPE